MAVNMNVTPPDITGGTLTLNVNTPYTYECTSTVPVSSYQYSGTLEDAFFVSNTLVSTGAPNSGSFQFVVDGIQANGSTTYTYKALTGGDFAVPLGRVSDRNGDIYYANAFGYWGIFKFVGGLGPPQLVAGDGSGSSGVDGTGAAAGMGGVYGVTYDSNADVFYTVTGSAIRKVTPAGVVTTIAGDFTDFGYLNGTGTAARFNLPRGLDLDASGNIYVADTTNHRIRLITMPSTTVSLVAGSGTSGYLDSASVGIARFSSPRAVAVNRLTGDIYVADTGNWCIRKISSNGVTTFAGTNASGYVDGTGTAARFLSPTDIVWRPQDNCLYVVDLYCIRKITMSGVVTTIAGDASTDDPLTDGINQAAVVPAGGIGVSDDGTLYITAVSLTETGLAKIDVAGPEVRPSGTRPAGYTIVSTTGIVQTTVVTEIVPVTLTPPLVNGLATLYKYSPFQYTFYNPELDGFTVTSTPELAPFVTIDPATSTASFASSNGFQTSYTSTFPITFNALSGSNVVDTYSFNVQVLPGRFTTPAAGFSNTFYLNEAISPILFQADISMTQIYSAPSLPPGLSFVQVDASGFQYRLQGTPLVTSVPTSYNIVGRNTHTGRIVSVSNVYRVDPERIVLSVNGSSNVDNMIVDAPIVARAITAKYPMPGSFQYRWTQVLPPNISLTNLSGTPVVSGFVPTDPSSTILLQGAPSLALAQFLSSNGNAYPFTLTANVVRSGSVLSASIPFTFSFAETVLFSNPPSNVTIYNGDLIDSTNGYFFNAATFFGSSGISNIFSPDLRSDLSLTYVGGGTSFLSGTATFSEVNQPYTVRAVNSNGVFRDTTVRITSQPDIVTFAAMDACSTFIFSRPLAQAKAGYYNAPIVFRATATSGQTITYDDGGVLAGTGLSLSNTGNNAQLVGTPITTLPLTTLTVTATAAETGSTGTKSIQLSIVPDSATWDITPSVPSEFIQNVETTPFQFRATTLSELPVSYYSASNLPVGLNLTSTGRLAGTPTIAGSGLATVTANTGYSALSTTFPFTVIPDAILFTTLSNIYPFTPGGTIPSIPIEALSYTGVTGSNYVLGLRDHISYGVQLSSAGVLSGTAISQSPPLIAYPSEAIGYDVSATAGNITDSFSFFLATNNPTTFRYTGCSYDASANQMTLQYANRLCESAGISTRPTATYWYTASNVAATRPTCVFTAGDSVNGEASSNVITSVYAFRASGNPNYVTSNGRTYEVDTIGFESNIFGPVLGSVAKNYESASEVYGVGAWYDFNAQFRPLQAAVFMVSTDNGRTYDASEVTYINADVTTDGTELRASPFAPLGAGFAVAHISNVVPSLVVGGSRDMTGNHSVLYGRLITSIYDLEFDPVTNEFGTITTDIRGPTFTNVTNNVFFVGSDTYDPYAPSWTYTGPAQTIKYAPILANTLSNVLSNSTGGFNVVGLKLYGFLQPGTGLYATGISHDGTGFVPELRRLRLDGVNWELVDLSTNPLFTPSLTKPDSNVGYGPVFFSGPEVSSKRTYVFVRNGTTTDLYVDVSGTWVREDTVNAPNTLTIGSVYDDQPNPQPYLLFPNQNGPAFPAQETRHLLYQYAPANIAVIPPTPEPDPYLYVRSGDLPPGLQFNALTGVIGGYPTTLVQDRAVTVYALQRTSLLVSQFTIYITVINPFVVRPQMSAAAYTSLLRQYVTANSTQNARDTKVFAGAERTQGAFGAAEGEDVTTQPRCDPDCPS
jgi:hypothetical protein